MSEAERIKNRRAIEALRAGVPNRDAVLALGSTQPEIEKKFREQLQGVGAQLQGMLVQGGFGAGKSHLLESLLQTALRENFVCSKIVISKETPFYDPAKLYRAAAEAAVVPRRMGDALTEIMTQMDTNSQAYADFFQWANRSSELSQMFAATLFIYERMPGAYNGEVRNRITRFWSGDRIGLNEIKRWLRDLRERVTFNLSKVPPKELALQRFKFAARLMMAAGYAGWVLFIDELELIGRYSLLQRAKSYAELSRFVGRMEGWQSTGLMSICSITDDFAREVLEDRNDLEKVPGRIRSRGTEADLLWASQAERGMRIIEREANPLASPDDSLLQAVYAKVKSIYADAYEWSPPDVTGVEKTITTRMRHYVKGWITEWDLKRKYPDYLPRIEGEDLKPGYSEDRDLQVSPEGESEE
ncbi:MAG: hypothetical protein FJ134_07795 [Deltaproteobacteria bacterium]|nr:hypothetical protein [Deltaproteobacteria bacterium]